MVVLAFAGLALLLAPTQASAQISPLPTGQDYCSSQSAPAKKFTAPNNGISYLNVSVQGTGSVEARMFGTSAGTGECIFAPKPPVCASPNTCRFDVQAVCEYHCQHDHTTPYPWTVLLYPIANAGNLLGWPGTECVPAIGTLYRDCVVRMPIFGTTTSATALFGAEPDTTPPTAPAARLVSTESYGLTIEWTASSDPWLRGYSVYNGTTELARVGTATTRFRLPALKCETTYNLRVVAFDAHNTAESTVSATTGACLRNSDTTPPNVVFHVGPPKLPATTRSRTAYFHWGATEASRFRCKLDARPWAKCRLSDPYVMSMGKTYRNLARGYHTFRVRAIDKAGNVDPTPAVRRWRIR